MIAYVDFDRTFLDLSWEWLKEEELKRLTNTPTFSRAQQKRWFESLSQKEDYFIKGVQVDKQPVGVVGLKNITKTKGEYWGYIAEKEYWGQGIGKHMLQFILEEGRQRGLETIHLHVLKFNQRALRLYERNGFLLLEEQSSEEEWYLEHSLIINE